MRVNIGPYKNWFGPHQLAEALCWWAKTKPDEYGTHTKPEWVDSFGDWLAHGNAPDEENVPRSQRIFRERPKTWVYRLLLWIESKKKRKIEVRVDPWDTWNMDGTLSIIILPMLKQLQATKHGAGFVDDADVPDELRSTAAAPLKNEYDTDENFFKRFDWVLDELIWTFTQLQPDCDWEDQYRSGEMDLYSEPVAFNADGTAKMYEMKRGPHDTYKVDQDGRTKHQERIKNGLRLFGKYFQNLWD